MGSLGRNLRIKYKHCISYRGILVIATYYYNIRINAFVCRRRILSRKMMLLATWIIFGRIVIHNKNIFQESFLQEFSQFVFFFSL